MFLGLFGFCFSLVAGVMCKEPSSEPACSKFDFEEKTLFKLVRLEFSVEQTKEAVLAALSDMRSEVAVMRGERDAMKAEVDAIKRERDALKDQISRDLKTEVDKFQAAQDTAVARLRSLEGNLTELTATPTIWFLANDPKNSNPQPEQVILYANVEKNVGDGYDVKTGKFTAPVKGVYAFSIYACAHSSNNFHYGIRTDKEYLVKGRSYDKGGSYPCNSATVYSSLDVGERVWVTVPIRRSAVIYTGNSYQWNMFSGILVHKSP